MDRQVTPPKLVISPTWGPPLHVISVAYLHGSSFGFIRKEKCREKSHHTERDINATREINRNSHQYLQKNNKHIQKSIVRDTLLGQNRAEISRSPWDKVQ